MEKRLVVGDYRAALQTATAPLHVEIDALFGAFDLADRDGLTRFLMAQAIGMQACQSHIGRFSHQAFGRNAPDYEQVLLVDLATLGVDAAKMPRLELPINAAGGAGVFYVVAGSRMGAAVLRQRATASTPIGPAHSVCGYFAPGDGPAMWRLFRQWLQNAAGPDDLPAMIEGAKATFHLFAQAAQWAAAQPPTVLPDGNKGLAA